MVKWRNTWWRHEDGAKGAAKNCGLRFGWAIYNTIRACKELVVLIPFLLAIGLLFFGTWLKDISTEQQVKTTKPLNDTDRYIDETVDGINYVTQDVPIKIIWWFDGVMNDTEDTMKGLTTNAAGNLAGGVNFISDATESGLNKAINWCGTRVGYPNPPTVNIPTWNLQMPTFAAWRPPINYTKIIDDLDVIKIPERNFSIEGELTPFVQQVFAIPISIAEYCIALGIILVVYVGLRLLCSFLYAFVPSPKFENKKVEACVTISVMIVKGTGKALKQALKPWIHIPIIIGVLMCIVSVSYLDPSIDVVDKEIRVPLVAVDNEFMKIINKVNNFTYNAPRKIKSFTDEWQDAVTSNAFYAIQDGVNEVLTGINGVVNDFEARLTLALNYVGINGFSIPTWDRNSISLGTPDEYIPKIPLIDTSELRIDPDTISLQKAVGPWVDDRVEDARNVSRQIFWTGFFIAAIPSFTILLAFASAFIPKKGKQFLKRPRFHAQETESESESSSDEEIEMSTKK